MGSAETGSMKTSTRSAETGKDPDSLSHSVRELSKVSGSEEVGEKHFLVMGERASCAQTSRSGTS